MSSATPHQVVKPSLAPPLKWFGGKHYLAGWIIEHMPAHVHYVEPYAGGLSVLLQKSPYGVSEVVNDLNRDLTNFWRVLQDPASFTTFQRIVEATPFSKVEFREAADLSADPIRRAVNFFIRCRQSRQAEMKKFTTLSTTRTRRKMNEQVSSWLTSIEGLPEIYDRLKRVVVLNDDALAVIAREDSPATLFYCDPPYCHETRVTTDSYAHEMTREDHGRLLTLLAGIKGKFILSGYSNDLYNEFAARNGWQQVDREIDCKASGAKEKPKRIESLWMNY